MIGNGNMVVLDLIKSAILGISLESYFFYPFPCKLLFPDFWSKSLPKRNTTDDIICRRRVL